MSAQTIDQKTLTNLVEAGAVRAAHVVGHGNGWAMMAKYGMTERFLAVKQGDVRVFRKFETLVNFLRDMGISQFDVNTANYDPTVATRPARPDRSAALKEAHAARAHDQWFREQVQESLDDPTPAVSHEDAKAEFAALRAQLSFPSRSATKTVARKTTRARSAA
jgi:hypothetical protein